MPLCYVLVAMLCEHTFALLYSRYQTDEAEGRRRTREERAWDGVSQDEMRGAEWAAEGAPNGAIPVGCDVRHTSRAGNVLAFRQARGQQSANQGGTASHEPVLGRTDVGAGFLP